MGVEPSLAVGGCGLEEAGAVILDRVELPRQSVSLGDRVSQFSFRLVEGSGRRVQALLELFAACGLLSELAVHVRDHGSERLDFAVLARVINGMTVSTDKHLFQSANGRVARL